LVDKSEVLAGKWRRLWIELVLHDESGEVKGFDGYSWFWCKEAVLGTYRVAEIVDGTTVKIHLTEDIELEGLKRHCPLSQTASLSESCCLDATRKK
jgi:hypothetical protein